MPKVNLKKKLLSHQR